MLLPDLLPGQAIQLARPVGTRLREILKTPCSYSVLESSKPLGNIRGIRIYVVLVFGAAFSPRPRGAGIRSRISQFLVELLQLLDGLDRDDGLVPMESPLLLVHFGKWVLVTVTGPRQIKTKLGFDSLLGGTLRLLSLSRSRSRSRSLLLRRCSTLLHTSTSLCRSLLIGISLRLSNTRLRSIGGGSGRDSGLLGLRRAVLDALAARSSRRRSRLAGLGACFCWWV